MDETMEMATEDEFLNLNNTEYARGFVVGAVTTVVCYWIGRGIGTLYCNFKDRREAKNKAQTEEI